MSGKKYSPRERRLLGLIGCAKSLLRKEIAADSVSGQGGHVAKWEFSRLEIAETHIEGNPITSPDFGKSVRSTGVVPPGLREKYIDAQYLLRKVLEHPDSTETQKQAARNDLARLEISAGRFFGESGVAGDKVPGEESDIDVKKRIKAAWLRGNVESLFFCPECFADVDPNSPGECVECGHLLRDRAA